MRQKLLLSIAIFSLTFAAASDAMCQWVQTNGPFGGEVSCFATMGMNLFAGAFDAGVFRSTDSGKSWKATGSYFSDESAITAIGTNIIAASDDGVFYSTDSGTSWNSCAGISSGGGFTEVTGMVAIGRCLFAATLSEGSMCRTYLSKDSGKTWIDTLQAPDNIESLIVINGQIFAGADGGGYLSTDTGITWIPNSSGLAFSYASSFAVSGSNLFAIASSDSGKSNHVFLSTDNGANWTMADTNLPPISFRSIATSGPNIYVGTDSGVYLSTNNGGDWTPLGLAFANIYSLDVIGQNTLVGTDIGVNLTTDNGKNWAKSGVPSSDVYSLAVSGSKLYAGVENVSIYQNGAVVYTTTNKGITWSPQNIDQTNGEVYVEALAVSGQYLFKGSYRSSDDGQNWDQSNNGTPVFLANSFVEYGSYLFAGIDGGVFVTSDNGNNWYEKNNGLTNTQVNALAIRGLNLFAGTGGGVFRSTDKGDSWFEADNGIPDTLIYTLAVCGNNIFAYAYPDGVFISSDNGSNWISANTGLDNSFIHGFAVSGMNIFACTNSGIFVSSDNGSNWELVNSGMDNIKAQSLIIMDTDLIAGTIGAGVWRRPLSDMATPDYILEANADTISFGSIPVGKDSLQIVTLTNNGKTPLTIRSFLLTQTQNVFATSDLSSEVMLQPGEHFTFEAYFQPTEPGVYTANLLVVSEAGEVNLTFIGKATGAAGIDRQLQSDSKLTVYPNPFSQSSTITFSCPESGVGEVTIVNLLGAEVARLFSGELGEGEHSFEWDASGAAPGIYECIVRANRSVQRIAIVHLSEP